MKIIVVTAPSGYLDHCTQILVRHNIALLDDAEDSNRQPIERNKEIKEIIIIQIIIDI